MHAKLQRESGSQTRASPNLPQQLAYVLPVLSVAFLTGPLAVVQGIYAKHFGLGLTTIAMVLLISRLFDAVTDPIIGYLSDRYHARTGSRKPFIVFGGVLFIISSYFLFVPVNLNALGADTRVSTGYFLTWFIAFYLALTLFEIPHLTWGSELADTPEDTNTVYGLRTAATFLGAILFYTLPLLPVFATNAFTPQTLQWAVPVAGFLMLITLYISMQLVPTGQSTARQAEQASAIQNHDLKAANRPAPKQDTRWVLMRILLANKPFLLFLGAFFLSGTGVGCCVALLFIYIDSYLSLGEHFALVSLLSIAVATLSLGLWRQLANYLGKRQAWAISTAVVVVGLLGITVLVPGESGLLPLMLVMILINSGLAGSGILPPSILSDIIDYSTWKFRIDRAATHFSIYTLVVKANAAMGGALGLAIAGWYGFEPALSTQSADALFGVKLAMGWLPAFMVLISIVFIVLIPINAHRHSIIRRRLDARAARSLMVASRSFKNTLPTNTESQSTDKFMQTQAVIE